MKANASTVKKCKADLPLLEQPPTGPHLNSADELTVNVGSGDLEGGIPSGGGALREPAIGHAGSSGREAKDGLSGIADDAVTQH